MDSFLWNYVISEMAVILLDISYVKYDLSKYASVTHVSTNCLGHIIHFWSSKDI